MKGTQPPQSSSGYTGTWFCQYDYATMLSAFAAAGKDSNQGSLFWGFYLQKVWLKNLLRNNKFCSVRWLRPGIHISGCFGEYTETITANRLSKCSTGGNFPMKQKLPLLHMLHLNWPACTELVREGKGCKVQAQMHEGLQGRPLCFATSCQWCSLCGSSSPLFSPPCCWTAGEVPRPQIWP